MSVEQRTTQHSAALALAKEGLRVVPCYTPTAHGGCSCGKADCDSPGKHPRTLHGCKDATSDPGQIDVWWTQWPDANIGVATGEELHVVDVDGPEAQASFDALCLEHEPLPLTRAVRTGRDGGRHLWFRPPGGIALRGRRLLQKVDTRGEGHYVMAPPSLHASGRTYEWETPDAPIAELPAWTVEKLSAPRSAGANGKARPRARGAADDAAGNGHVNASDTELLQLAFNARNGDKVQALYNGDTSGHGGDHSAADLALVNALAFWTGPDPERIDRLFRDSGLMREKWDREDYRTSTIERALQGRTDYYKWGAANTANGAAASPTIVANGRPTRFVADDAIAALRDANDPPALFVRAGTLTRTRRDEKDRPIVEPVSESALRGILMRSAFFMKKGKDGQTHIAPPIEIVRDALTLGQWPQLPALAGITETPALRADGTVLHTPGYDAASGLAYMPARALTVPPVADHPSPRACRQSLELLGEAIANFPFVDTADRGNALALMLTPILRPVIARQVPLALLDAPKAGTGKGLLASLVSLITTGRSAAVFTAPTREEEWAKSLLALLMEGSTFVLIDEINELRSPALAGALTASTIRGRPLGITATVEVPQRATWVAAGNNIRLGGDLPRRSYWIRLDAKTSRPWQRRDFRHPDLLAWAGKQRGQLLWALLTLARAWFDAGQPAASVPALGGFEDWARIVGGVLAHAGVDGFLANLEDLYDQADEDSTKWEAFLSALIDVYGERPFTVSELDRQLRGESTLGDDRVPGEAALRDSLPDDLADALGKPNSFKTKLGKALGKRRGTRYGSRGLRVERQKQSPQAINTWCVYQDEKRSNGEPTPTGQPTAQAPRSPASTDDTPSLDDLGNVEVVGSRQQRVRESPEEDDSLTPSAYGTLQPLLAETPPNLSCGHPAGSAWRLATEHPWTCSVCHQPAASDVERWTP